MIGQALMLKSRLTIIVFVFLCGGACFQATTQTTQTPSNNSAVKTASPFTVANTTGQASPTSQNVNNVATSVDANTASQEAADKGKVQRVQFARGRNSATFKDAVYQNKDNEYLFDARAQQTMTVSMKVDQNRNSPDADSDVVFQIFKASDSEPFAKPDSNFWQGRLPETGEYIIRVTSFTDNNRYTLKITIR